MARGTPDALAIGPGYLYYGSGATEPTDLAATWASLSWIALGYTAEGSEFKYSLSTDTVEVAEELDPILTSTTGRSSTITFALAEVTAANLKRAMNGGTITPGSGLTTFEPPDLGAEVRCQLGFESEDHEERWVFRQCFQTGDTTITRAKGAANATIACEFTLEKPSSGAKLFKVIMKTPERA